MTKVETVAKKEQVNIPVYSSSGQTKTETIDISSLESKVKPGMVAQAIRVFLARTHQGTVYTKDHSEVSGGGRKPWRQKGTGRARQGSIRSPQWVGGGVVRGPKGEKRQLQLPKSWNKKVLTELLKKAILEDALVIVEEPRLEQPKTKDIINLLSQFNPTGKVLLVVEKADPNLTLSTRNISNLTLTIFQNLDSLKLLKADKIAFTQQAFGMAKELLGGKNAE